MEMRYAVLRDYPLRLWLWQQEHFDGLLREFSLLLIGASSGQRTHDVPARLVALAEMFTTRFGGIIDAINAERYAALDRGLDRMDSRVPLVEETPELMRQLGDVMAAVDAYCLDGQLLSLARPPELVALSQWTRGELLAQYDGAEPTPWPGPF